MIGPIIFLDFDGVLNSMTTRGRNPRGWNELDREMVERVNRIIDRTGAKVVVSSSWRLFERRDENGNPADPQKRLTRILQANGFRGEVIGVTPYLPQPAGDHPRGIEIQAWLDEAKHSGPFVILDDDSDMLHLLPKLVQTRDSEGLQDTHVELAVRQLDGSAAER